MPIILGFLINSLAGLIIHRKITNFLDRNYSEAFARVAAEAVGLSWDIPSSYVILMLYSRYVSDRRKVPIAFERYLIVRILAIATLMVGVIIGYMLDLEHIERG